MEEAERFFDNLKGNRNHIHWNQMISGYAKLGDEDTTDLYFRELLLSVRLIVPLVLLAHSLFASLSLRSSVFFCTAHLRTG